MSSKEARRKKMAAGYSSTKRFFDTLGLVIFYVLLWVGAWQLIGAHWQWWLVAPLCFVIALLLADFFSGIVHWAADTWGTYDEQSSSATWIRPFRHHHIDPQSIVRHSFVERNGSATLVVLPILVGMLFIKPASFVSFSIKLGLFFFSLGINLTNQHHAWAHSAHVPAAISWLQKLRLF